MRLWRLRRWVSICYVVCLRLTISGHWPIWIFYKTSKTTSIAWNQVSRIASIYGVVAFLRKAFLLSPFLVFNFIFHSASIDYSHLLETFHWRISRTKHQISFSSNTNNSKCLLFINTIFIIKECQVSSIRLGIVSFVLHTIVESP